MRKVLKIEQSVKTDKIVLLFGAYILVVKMDNKNNK